MTNSYSLWIVSPPGLIWSHVFDEVALGLQFAFNELGYKVAIVTDPARIEGTPIVLGVNLCPMYHVVLPENAIIFNCEQVHPASRWFAPDYGYTALLKKHPVWDYSRHNIANLQKMGIENVVHCALGYAPVLTRIPKAKQDMDVVFIGGHHPRRQKVLEEITGNGAGLHQVYKVFGKERDHWIARGKIQLNVHKEPARLFEIVRVSYLLANGCFVISEECHDQDMMEAFRDAMVFCPYEQLAERCNHYLVHPKERKRIAEAGFEIFRKMPQAEFLAAALEEHRRLHARKPAQSRIFVAIASFRDPEIQPTLMDMFSKALYPERLQVGVCLQVNLKTDANCMIDTNPWPERVQVRQYHYTDSKGANWARDQALQLMGDEQYVLLIDSHMRFSPEWDTKMLSMLEKCPSEKPVLSGYVPGYRPPNSLLHHKGDLLRMRLRKLGSNGDDPVLVRITGIFVSAADERTSLYPAPLCVANFIFTRASTFKEVPLDPHIYFWGDEINFAARLWTHGYDIFQPDCVVLHHYWVRKDQFHLHDYREHLTPDNKRSMARIRHLLGLKKTKDAAALVDIERYGLGKERVLEDLWKFAGIDWNQRKITENAEQGLWNMAAREEGRMDMNKRKKKVAVTPGGQPGEGRAASASQAEKRIFVQIASYRDPDCQWTVKDLFEKASHPERIFVGICWQFIKEEDATCFQIPYPHPSQVRVHEVHAKEGKGVCWARNLAQKLWQGEEFTLQIDSHMRFEPGWDDTLLSMWEECGSEKAVITCYPPGFTPPDTFERKFFFGMGAKEFDKEGIFLMRGIPAYEVGKNEPPHPVHGAFASANMLFGPASIIADVPYDPHLYFFGEEITLAVRLWTSGYDLFHPNRLVIFHDWDRNKRPTHFADYKDWGSLNKRSFARVRHLLKTEYANDPEVTDEIDKYGLGKIRTLEEYQAFSGVDFARKLIRKETLQGIFPPFSSPLVKKGNEKGKTPRIFVNIASYRDPECQWTVKDLYAKAQNPDRINVGICWQFDQEKDQHCFEVSTRPDQVRIFPVDWREAEGVCWARYQTQQLWEGEEYTLMIDSHMRFVPGWDELMIQELAACESYKPVLSNSPVPYTPPDKLGTRMNPTIRRVKPFFPDGNIRCHGEMLDHTPPKPLKGAFIVANFIFSRSEITPEVPYDPYLYFDQEEITYAARLYTHGWDVFSSRSQFMYHYYNDSKAPTGSVRPLHWRDLKEENERRIAFLRDRGLKRFNHLTRYRQSTDPEVIKELDKYGFGHVRSIDQFEQYSGVDFRNKIATEKALRCGFIENLHLYRDRPIHVPEIDSKKNTSLPAGVAEEKSPQANTLQYPPTPNPQREREFKKMLEPGDFFPLLEIGDTNRKLRAIEMFAGKYCLVFYLPAGQPEFLERFFHELTRQLELAKIQDIWQLFILDDTPEKLITLKEQLKTPHSLCADPNRIIARSFGLGRPGEMIPPIGFVLNQNLKIQHRHIEKDPSGLVAAMVHDCSVEMEKFREKYRQPKFISEMPPALIVPNVLSAELRAKCIHAFRNGHTFEGTVGAEASKAYRSDIKIRTDYIVQGELLAEIDEKLSSSFFPEIKKIFGFDVTHRELYKIGLYTGEKKGFFKQHRDNFDSPMGYRRIASTIHLNDEYEGGGLRFPEYGDDIYRPDAGSGIAFSCSTVHEAKPVTKGERFVLVGFFHGEEEEAYRRHYAMSKNQPLKIQEFTPVLRTHSAIRQSRTFYDKWHEQNIRYTGDNAPAVIPPENPVPTGQPVMNVMVNTIGNHRPRKVFESKMGIIFDDFLPEDVYEQLNSYALTTDYERINTHGKSVRAWHVHDGFPLRSCKNAFFHATEQNPKPDHVYPTHLPFDRFIDHIVAIQPHVEHVVGKREEGWEHFSVTSWLYPHGTGLAMHDDGSGVYTGAYVYFLNPQWRAHWGGLLVMLDDEANRRIHEHRSKTNQMDYYQRKWLHANSLDEIAMEYGFGKCIMPKRNRIVFIANDAYHMVTRVNEQSGDNLRMSLAGFFNRRKNKK